MKSVLFFAILALYPLGTWGLNQKLPVNSIPLRSKFETLLYPTASIKAKTRKSTLFKSTPELRKIIISYVNNKLFRNHNNCRMFCCKQKIKHALSSIVPPVEKKVFEREVNEIFEKFDGKLYVEEHEFSSRIVMDNGIWEAAGETVVKELIYLDNIHSRITTGESILSDCSFEKLENSLREDHSAVAKLSEKDALTAYNILNKLNCALNDSCVVAVNPDEYPPEDLKFLKQSKEEFYDTYGNPTLLMYLAEHAEV